MAFENLIASINLLLEDIDNPPHDALELLEQVHMELAQMRATGQPLPEDLLELERRLAADFTLPPKSGN